MIPGRIAQGKWCAAKNIFKPLSSAAALSRFYQPAKIAPRDGLPIASVRMLINLVCVQGAGLSDGSLGEIGLAPWTQAVNLLALVA